MAMNALRIRIVGLTTSKKIQLARYNKGARIIVQPVNCTSQGGNASFDANATSTSLIKAG
jgi:hypothetical protein